MKDSFIFYTKYEEQISLLSDAQAGVLFRALICYQSNKELPEMDGMTNIVFTVIRQQIDVENQKHDEISKARKTAGKKGGRPSKSLENKGNKPKKANGLFVFDDKPKKANGFQNNQMVLERESAPNKEERTKEENITLEREEKERKKEIYINNNLTTACACEEKDENESDLISHDEIMRGFGISKTLTDSLKEFLRQCYLNGHLVSNAKLADIVFRLVDDLDDDPARIKCVERAISGGYFDVKT